MRRFLVICGAALAAAGCRTYENYQPLANQKGLIPADQWAGYGQEQAQAIAIGRAFGSAHEGTSPEARALQMEAAVTAAEGLGAEVLVADPDGYRLTVRFPSGWTKAILPIDG